MYVNKQCWLLTLSLVDQTACHICQWAGKGIFLSFLSILLLRTGLGSLGKVLFDCLGWTSLIWGKKVRWKKEVWYRSSVVTKKCQKEDEKSLKKKNTHTCSWLANLCRQSKWMEGFATGLLFGFEGAWSLEGVSIQLNPHTAHEPLLHAALLTHDHRGQQTPHHQQLLHLW